MDTNVFCFNEVTQSEHDSNIVAKRFGDGGWFYGCSKLFEYLFFIG